MEEERGALSGFGFVGEDADAAVGVEAVDDTRSGADARPQTFVADGDATVGADFQDGAHTPDVGPPGAARTGAQHAAFFALGGARGGVGGALEFAMDFVGVAVTAQIRQKRVGCGGRADRFGGEEGGQAALPVLVLAFDLAFGLRGARIAQGDAVKVQGLPQLGEGLGALGKEQTVAIDVKFQGQAMLGESGGQEVEVSEQVFTVIDRGSGADARAVIQQIQERIMFSVAGEPAMRRGVELPERADFQALPAAHRSRRARSG